LHADDHPLAVDRRWRQADRFGDTQAGRVADGQDGAMLPAVDGVEEPGDLVLAGSFCGLRQVGMISSTLQPRLSVTLYRKRMAATATNIELAESRFSWLRWI